MLEAIREGEADAVLVWHMDRLHRRPIELEEFADTCTRAGVKDVVTLHGEFDLGNGDGLLVARLMAAVAANESDAKSRRTKRKQRELAERGLPSGGGTRPFGFAPDRLHLDEAEADVIRALAARLLAGEPLVSLARWLQESEVRTVTGKEWRTPTVRNLLLSPRDRRAARVPRTGHRQGRMARDHQRGRLRPDRRPCSPTRPAAPTAPPAPTCSPGCCAAAGAEPRWSPAAPGIAAATCAAPGPTSADAAGP